MSKIDIFDIIKLRHFSDTVGGVTLICCWMTGNGYLKGHNFVSGVGLPSASSCKDPKYVLNELDPKGSFFLFLRWGKLRGIFRQKNLKSGGLLRPPF